MDKNALLYYQSADTLKFTTSIIQHIAGFEIKLGKKRYFFRGGDTPFNYSSSLGVAKNKFCMNKLLESAGFPVPKAIAFNKNDVQQHTLESLIEGLNFPLVAKPTIDTSAGVDVLCHINDIVQLETYLEDCFKRHEFISVEEYHAAFNAYRVLVFYNKVIGVVQRFPAQILGDGIHSIKELIALSNIEREKLQDTVSLGPISIDEEYHIRLKELQMTVDTIPKDKESIVLCYTCNSSRGGTMKSLGKQIGKENARLLCNAARALNMNIVGFDVLCDDILIPFKHSRGVIIEANHQPDISIHENPMSGSKNRVSKKILRRLMFKHPIAYVLGLYQNKSYGFYIKSSSIIFILFACKLLFS